jgi:hypothetical protein
MVWEGGVGPAVHGSVPIVMVLAVTVVVTVVVTAPCAKEMRRAAWRRPKMVKTMPGSKYFVLR